MRSFFKRIGLVCLGCIAANGLANGDDTRYVCVPQKMVLQQKSHNCYYAVHRTDIDAAAKGDRCSSGELIGYICQGEGALTLVMVNEKYASRDVLNTTFNKVVESGIVEIPIGGKTANGAYWDGIKRVKKEDPDYYFGFGDYFLKVFERNLWNESRNSKESMKKNATVCVDELFQTRESGN